MTRLHTLATLARTLSPDERDFIERSRQRATEYRAAKAATRTHLSYPSHEDLIDRGNAMIALSADMYVGAVDDERFEGLHRLAACGIDVDWLATHGRAL